MDENDLIFLLREQGCDIRDIKIIVGGKK